MKRYLLLLFISSFLSSCVTQSQLIDTNDPYKKIQNIKLLQYVHAKSAERDKGVMVSKDYWVTATYLFEQAEDGNSVVGVEFNLTVPLGVDDMDSVAFINLDGEVIRMMAGKLRQNQIAMQTETTDKSGDSSETKATNITTSNYQLIKCRFPIQENLWASIKNSRQIKYRIYLGKDGFDMVLSRSQNVRLNHFFELALSRRDASKPPLPEGKMKW